MSSTVTRRSVLKYTTASAALAAGASNINRAAAAVDEILVAELGVLADAPFYIGIEKGYFEQQKVKVGLRRFGSGADFVAPLSSNQIQVGGGGFSAGFINAYARDWPLRIVLTRIRDIPGNSSQTIIVRNALKGEVKSMADLKGRKVANNAPGSLMHFTLGKMMEKSGLSVTDVTLVSMPWPNMGQALETGAVDAAMIAEPFVAILAEKGIAFPLKRAAELIKDPYLESSLVLYNKDFIEKSRPQAEAFTVAYMQGARDFYQAMKHGPNRPEIIKILQKYTSLKDAALYDKIQWVYMDPNGTVDFDGLRDQEDWFIKQGLSKSRIDLGTAVDTSLVDHALKVLGKVDVK
jgi:ABC-type nitrate/sulfonate/bicarbonate transport systems, periplasmic components